MTKKEMVNYLLSELSDLRKASELMDSTYRDSNHMERIGMSSARDKAETKYYHFWMVCNDLGIISPHS